jgi:ABC-type nitrate/sulfonate/bicarbonate transport system permease component
MSVALDTPRAGGGAGGALVRWLRSDTFARLASYLFLLLLWQLASMYEDRFPGPAESLGFLWIEVTAGSHGGIVRGEFLEHFLATLPRFSLGIAISLVLGVTTGV